MNKQRIGMVVVALVSLVGLNACCTWYPCTQSTPVRTETVRYVETENIAWDSIDEEDQELSDEI